MALYVFTFTYMVLLVFENKLCKGIFFFGCILYLYSSLVNIRDLICVISFPSSFFHQFRLRVFHSSQHFLHYLYFFIEKTLLREKTVLVSRSEQFFFFFSRIWIKGNYFGCFTYDYTKSANLRNFVCFQKYIWFPKRPAISNCRR